MAFDPAVKLTRPPAKTAGSAFRTPRRMRLLLHSFVAGCHWQGKTTESRAVVLSRVMATTVCGPSFQRRQIRQQVGGLLRGHVAQEQFGHQGFLLRDQLLDLTGGERQPGVLGVS